MKHILPILISILLYSCASIVPPTGGDKDETAPQWNRALSIPDSINNTSFSGQSIVLEFNEPVDVKNLHKEIVSNPDVNKIIDYRIKNKKVEFTFTEPLDSNTTYVINFGNSIVDITESNPAKNITVAFSTGSQIDTLKLYGTIKDNLLQTPTDNIVVGLYPSNDTLDITTQKPKYYTKTESAGQFKFEYIKNDKYIIRAFEDLNSNLLYDSYKEKVGFLDSIYQINESITNMDFNLFTEIRDTLYIKSIKRKDDHIAVLFSQAVQDYKISSDKTSIISKYDKDENIIKIFTLSENPIFRVEATDISGHSIDSTAKITNFTSKGLNKIKLINETLSNDYQLVNNKFTTNINFLSPLDSIIYDSLDIIHGTDSLKGPLNEFFSYQIDSTKMILKLTSTFSYHDSLQIIFNKGVLKNIYGQVNKKQTLYYKKLNPKKYGVLAGKIKCHFDNYIFQLISNKKIIKEHKNIVAFEFLNLKPGSYTFRIINDQNINNIYDTGNLKELIQPEEIFYHPTAIPLKANWEIIDLLIDTIIE